MTLDHVDKSPGAVVEAGPPFEAERFVEDDVDALDVLGIEQRLEHAVGEAHSGDVYDRRRPQEVVHAVHLVLGNDPGHQPVKRVGAGRVGAERLLEDEP